MLRSLYLFTFRENYFDAQTMLLSAMGTIKDIFHIVILSGLDIALHIVHSLGKHDITTFDYNLKTRTTFLLQVFLFVCNGRRCACYLTIGAALVI